MTWEKLGKRKLGESGDALVTLALVDVTFLGFLAILLVELFFGEIAALKLRNSWGLGFGVGGTAAMGKYLSVFCVEGILRTFQISRDF